MKAKMTKSANILVIEDEDDIRKLIEYYLKTEGYTVVTADNGEAGLEKVRQEKPDLLVLDLMLPGLDGRDICRILKADSRTLDLPIVMLTARSSDDDIVEGLEIGADDYITKPFSPKVLIARIRKILDNGGGGSRSEDLIRHGDLEVNYRNRDLSIASQKIDLTYTEFEMLYLFISHPGQVFSRFEIVNAIKGDNYIVTDRTIDFQMVGLRKKLGSYARLLKTVRGAGYKFQADE